MTMTGKIRYKVGPLHFMQLNLQLTQRKQKSNPLLTFSLDRNKESTETYLLELTPYKGLCVVVCLLNGH